mgnify:CR=1 FL=1
MVEVVRGRAGKALSNLLYKFVTGEFLADVDHDPFLLGLWDDLILVFADDENLYVTFNADELEDLVLIDPIPSNFDQDWFDYPLKHAKEWEVYIGTLLDLAGVRREVERAYQKHVEELKG